MTNFSRREFLSYGSKLALLMGLSETAVPELASALEKITRTVAPVLWLQGQSCSGCSVSFLNSVHPTPLEVLTQYINLKFHSTLSAATGEMCAKIIKDVSDAGSFVLVVEGTIPAAMPHACVMSHRPMADWVSETAAKAMAVIAVGSCAAVGGIPAAENNPTGAQSCPEFLASKGVKTPVVTLPGCPCHPDWLVGTVTHVLSFGLPPLDNLGRPTMFYAHSLHDQCMRFADYERLNFAKKFGDSGCLFKLGCLGPITKADCTNRGWNGGANTCIRAGAPCIGCAAPNFARKKDFAFYRINPAFAADDDKRKE